MNNKDLEILHEGPSKSQLKRNSEDLQKIGQQLTEATPSLLKKLELPENLLRAINEYNNLPNKHGAKRRQLQFIGKVMRDLSDDEVEKILRQTNQNSALIQRRTQEMDQLLITFLTGDDSGVELLMKRHPKMDLQQLRQLIRQARKEQVAEKQKAEQKELQNQHQKDPVAAAQRAANALYNTGGSRKLLQFLRDLNQE
ncbi:MAG: ribosome biogenesis factor YjgA [Pseudomonadota bacterium]